MKVWEFDVGKKMWEKWKFTPATDATTAATYCPHPFALGEGHSEKEGEEIPNFADDGPFLSRRHLTQGGIV